MIENKSNLGSCFNYFPSLNTKNLPEILLKVVALINLVVVSAGLLGRGPLAALIEYKLMTKVAVVISTVFVLGVNRIISGIYQETINNEKLDKTKDSDQIERDAKKAAGGEIIHTEFRGTNYENLRDMVNKATVEQIIPITRGAANHEYKTGLSVVLAQLLINFEGSKDKELDGEKLNCAFHEISEDTLIEVISIHEKRIEQNLDDATYFHPTLHKDVKDQELKLFYKYKDVLKFSHKVVEKIDKIMLDRAKLEGLTDQLKRIKFE